MILGVKIAHSGEMTAPCTVPSSVVTRAAQPVKGQFHSEGRFRMHRQLTAGLQRFSLTGRSEQHSSLAAEHTLLLWL